MPGRIVLVAAGGVEVDSWPLPDLPGVGLTEVDALARTLLAARRVGLSVRLQDPGPDLVALLELTGLTDLSGLGIEPVGEAEGDEDLGADEVVVPGDPVT